MERKTLAIGVVGVLIGVGLGVGFSTRAMTNELNVAPVPAVNTVEQSETTMPVYVTQPDEETRQDAPQPVSEPIQTLPTPQAQPETPATTPVCR